MKNKAFTVLILGVILTRGILAQQLEKFPLERLTYEELKTDGTIGRTVTVEAYFLGWEQRETSMEGNYIVTYSCGRPYNGEWSDWEFSERIPAMLLTLIQYYNTIQREYNLHPKSGMKYYLNGMETVKIWAIPSGKASPFWWAENGKSFFSFYKFYAIKS